MKNAYTFLAGLVLAGLLSCKPAATTDTAPAADAQGMAATGQGTPFTVDAPRSLVKWSASKPTGTHNGIVPISSGALTFDNGQLTGGQVEINMAGIEVHDLEGEYRQSLEGHLRGTTPGKEEDFFNTGKYPTATFTITRIAPLANDPTGTHLVTGDLRIKDITKPVTVKARVDASAGTAVKISTDPFVIDRAAWDVRFKSKKFFADLGDDFINDEVTIQLELGALQQS
jgi:polyisoprenoid-binding protein YceI